MEGQELPFTYSGEKTLKDKPSQVAFHLSSKSLPLKEALQTLLSCLRTPFRVKPKSILRPLLQGQFPILIVLQRRTLTAMVIATHPNSFIVRGFVYAQDGLARLFPGSLTKSDMTVNFSLPGQVHYHPLTMSEEFMVFRVLQNDRLQEEALLPISSQTNTRIEDEVSSRQKVDKLEEARKQNTLEDEKEDFWSCEPLVEKDDDYQEYKLSSNLPKNVDTDTYTDAKIMEMEVEKQAQAQPPCFQTSNENSTAATSSQNQKQNNSDYSIPSNVSQENESLKQRINELKEENMSLKQKMTESEEENNVRVTHLEEKLNNMIKKLEEVEAGKQNSEKEYEAKPDLTERECLVKSEITEKASETERDPSDTRIAELEKRVIEMSSTLEKLTKAKSVNETGEIRARELRMEVEARKGSRNSMDSTDTDSGVSQSQSSFVKVLPKKIIKARPPVLQEKGEPMYQPQYKAAPTSTPTEKREESKTESETETDNDHMQVEEVKKETETELLVHRPKLDPRKKENNSKAKLLSNIEKYQLKKGTVEKYLKHLLKEYGDTDIKLADFSFYNKLLSNNKEDAMLIDWDFLNKKFIMVPLLLTEERPYALIIIANPNSLDEKSTIAKADPLRVFYVDNYGGPKRRYSDVLLCFLTALKQMRMKKSCGESETLGAILSSSDKTPSSLKLDFKKDKSFLHVEMEAIQQHHHSNVIDSGILFLVNAQWFIKNPRKYYAEIRQPNGYGRDYVPKQAIAEKRRHLYDLVINSELK
jgi:hypothetical protein